jgi:hypothetical protein
MALFVLTVKKSQTVNNIRLEAGMSVEIVSKLSNVFDNGAKEVQEAFLRKYNVDLKRANLLSKSTFDIKKN